MDIRQLIYFATIVEEGSISAAAKKLHLSQPPLSYQLKLLEEELHLQLLQRGARGVQLTEAGKVLYKRAQGILELTERTQKELQAMAGGFAGTLHIGTVSSSGASLLDWRIPAFHEQYPQIGFAIHEGNTFELMEMLESGLIELAVVRTPFHDEQVDCRYLQQEPMIAAASRRCSRRVLPTARSCRCVRWSSPRSSSTAGLKSCCSRPLPKKASRRRSSALPTTPAPR